MEWLVCPLGLTNQDIGGSLALTGRWMVAVKTNIFGRLRPRLLRFKKQFPDLFVRHAKELLQSSQPFRIKLPQTERPSLAWKGSADEHHLNHVGEVGVLLYDTFDALLQHQHLIGRSPGWTLVGP